MKREERFRRVLALLRELTAEHPITLQEKNEILKAIRPPQKRRGRKLDEDRYAAIAKSLTDLIPERSPRLGPVSMDEDESPIPSAEISRIAMAHSVSTRTVQRVERMLRAILSGEQIDSTKRGPIMRGVCRYLYASATRDTKT